MLGMFLLICMHPIGLKLDTSRTTVLVELDEEIILAQIHEISTVKDNSSAYFSNSWLPLEVFSSLVRVLFPVFISFALLPSLFGILNCVAISFS